ncbi:MAG: glycosyltransferase [Sphingobacteriales bacterium]|nr:glycosyltransferase [Sphingobacteriales bacterium]
MIVSQAQAKRPLIAVNARFLLHNKLEGIGRFTHETLKIITQANPHIDFAFLFDRAYHPQFIYGKNVIPHVLYPPARHPVLWYTWFEWRVPYLLKKLKPQLFFSPDGYCSLRSKTPTYMVVHDLAFEHLPQQVPPLVAKYYRYFSPKFATHAQHIATVSQFTKLDLVTKYKFPNKKLVLSETVSTLYSNLFPKRNNSKYDCNTPTKNPIFYLLAPCTRAKILAIFY